VNIIAVKIEILVFWYMTPCILAGDDHRIEQYTASSFIIEGGGSALVRNFGTAYQIIRCHIPEHHNNNIYVEFLGRKGSSGSVVG
jgi:hypothetical protein